MFGGGFLLAPITSSREALVLGGAFHDWVDSVSWEGLLPRGLLLVVEDTFWFPLLLGIPVILLPLDFADLVNTGRVLAEAAPSVVVRLVAGSDVFLDVCDVEEIRP